MAAIATTPLTDNERWTSMEPGRIVAFRDGAPVGDQYALGCAGGPPG